MISNVSYPNQNRNYCIFDDKRIEQKKDISLIKSSLETSKSDEDLPLEERRIKEIVFIEVKSGKSVLTKREKEVKNAIESGRVKYIEYRI